MNNPYIFKRNTKSKKSPIKNIEVVFNKEKLTIDFLTKNGTFYYLDLERANDSSELLDWIFQISNKLWAGPQVVNDMLEKLEEASEEILHTNIQGAFCPGAMCKSKKGITIWNKK